MAIHSKSIKVILISTSVLSMALMLKVWLPFITEFALSEVPSIWSFVISWLRPPYLYVVINCVIMTIVASSRLQSNVDDTLSPPETAILLQTTEPVKVAADARVNEAVVFEGVVVSKNQAVELRPKEFGDDYGASFVEFSEPDLYGDVNAMISNALDEMNIGNEFVISKSSWTALNKDPRNFSFPKEKEKPPVSARFGHRKSIKASPEGGRALGVSKSNRQDTLESTWKMITEGRSMPLTRHLRKSDTWETHGRHHSSQQHQDQMMTKFETFNVDGGGMDKNSPSSSVSLSRSTGSGKLRKEPSPSQDELNRRVETFIKKFNEDMRLQRQESLNQYMEMINRGAH